MGDRIWTDEQVAALNERQKRSDVHPYTCPGDYPECENRRNLIATPCGWVCACGRYRQGWPHEAGGRVPRAYTEAEVAAREAAAAEAMRDIAAETAREACLVPPDGGSPNADEVEVCDEAERRIRALPLPAADALARALEQAQAEGVEWAVDRWRHEVGGRPLGNIHRRSLDDVWRQVIRKFGGDPDALLGPDHDALCARGKEKQGE